MSRFVLQSALLMVIVACSPSYSTTDKSPIGTDSGLQDSGSGDSAADADTDTDSDTDSDTDADTDTGKDTGVDTGADTGIDTGDTDTATVVTCPTTTPEMVWVVQSLEVSKSTGGLDIDGDGTGDNVLAAVRDALNASILETFPTTPIVLAWQMWNVDDWCNDPDITGAFLSPNDADDNHADDYSGTESFDAGAQIDGKGHAVENGKGAIVDSVYTYSFASGSFYVGGFTLVNATPVIVQGTADESTNTGKFAFGMSVELMAEIAVAEGYDPSLADALADLDLDGDGVGDALSVTFDFTAVPATVY